MFCRMYVLLRSLELPVAKVHTELKPYLLPVDLENIMCYSHDYSLALTILKSQVTQTCVVKDYPFAQTLFVYVHKHFDEPFSPT